jgi:hypothetical protein
MDKPQEPEAAETVQTTNVPAVDLPRFVVPEIYPCRHCGEIPEWIDIPMGGNPPWDGKLAHKCLARSWSLLGGKGECFRDWNEVHGRAPLTGWIYVKCDICGDTWRETSRDIKAVSSVECVNGCEHGGDTHVWKRERCFLPTDRSGNLREYTKERLSSGLGHNTQSQAPADATPNPIE